MARRKTATLFGMLLLLALAPAAAQDSCPAGEIGLSWDSNLNNGLSGRERDDAFVIAELRCRRNWPLGRAVSLQPSLFLRSEGFERYDGLSNVGAGAALRLLLRGGAGAHAPTVELGGSGAWQEHDDALRDRARYRGLIALRQPLSRTFAARLQGALRKDDAHSAVFDGHSRQALVELEWIATPSLLLYASHAWESGDLAFTGLPPDAVLAAQPAITADSLYTAGESSWRLDADTRLAGVGFNWRLSPHLALDVFGRRIESRNQLGTRYRREQIFASLLFRF